VASAGGFVSWMDMLITMIHRSRPTLPHEAAESRLADHADLVKPFLSSTAGAWPGRARITECCTSPFNSSSLSLHCSALTHQVTLPQYSPHWLHYCLFCWCYAMGQKPWWGLGVGLPSTRPPFRKMDQNRTDQSIALVYIFIEVLVLCVRI